MKLSFILLSALAVLVTAVPTLVQDGSTDVETLVSRDAPPIAEGANGICTECDDAVRNCVKDSKKCGKKLKAKSCSKAGEDCTCKMKVAGICKPNCAPRVFCQNHVSEAIVSRDAPAIAEAANGVCSLCDQEVRKCANKKNTCKKNPSSHSCRERTQKCGCEMRSKGICSLSCTPRLFCQNRMPEAIVSRDAPAVAGDAGMDCKECSKFYAKCRNDCAWWMPQCHQLCVCDTSKYKSCKKDCDWECTPQAAREGENTGVTEESAPEEDTA